MLIRIGGEVDPVLIMIDHPVLKKWFLAPREVAWAMFAGLSDGLMTEADAVPDWAVRTVIPRDASGHPYPGMPPLPL
ncbi:hypothetical protein [Herbidospora mongoliensis]|uniref:hypothetical protein n=1 Tax=Herbidospora mongoliensis TaxID=688067 RepID=UPI000832E9B1|nr:hypothetical protein [Herbidospora mongoliensis]